MFIYQCFTENKGVINVKTVHICCSISRARFNVSKSPSVTRCSIACRLMNFSLNVENRNSESEKWILIMLSVTVVL